MELDGPPGLYDQLRPDDGANVAAKLLVERMKRRTGLGPDFARNAGYRGVRDRVQVHFKQAVGRGWQHDGLLYGLTHRKIGPMDFGPLSRTRFFGPKFATRFATFLTNCRGICR